jgi:hypothetical protein
MVGWRSAKPCKWVRFPFWPPKKVLTMNRLYNIYYKTSEKGLLTEDETSTLYSTDVIQAYVVAESFEAAIAKLKQHSPNAVMIEVSQTGGNSEIIV